MAAVISAAVKAVVRTNLRIIVSPKPQEPTKIIATHCEVGLIQIKFYRPNWFMRRSFVIEMR